MDSVCEDANQNLRERVALLLQQLRMEVKLFERVVYKGKNQHRRCQYFKSVLKVKRDLTLLLHSGVEEIFTNMFRVINEEEHGQRIHLLEKMKDMNVSGRCNIHERLLGVARLLSEMTEPIIVAALQISSLLARSFFMGYSLLLLSLLARTRVLLQQILLDSVSVFNMVSDISQKKHSIKVIEDGLEAYREYHPPQKEVIKLQCSWEKDKYVLHETIVVHNAKDEDEHTRTTFMGTPTILYETLSFSIAGLDHAGEHILEDLTNKPGDSPENADESDAAYMDRRVESIDDIVDQYSDNRTDELKSGNSPAKYTQGTTLPAKLTPCRTISLSEPCKKVAFVSVRTPSSQADDGRPAKKAKQTGLSDAVEGDHFFNLLGAGCTNEKPYG